MTTITSTDLAEKVTDLQADIDQLTELRRGLAYQAELKMPGADDDIAQVEAQIAEARTRLERLAFAREGAAAAEVAEVERHRAEAQAALEAERVRLLNEARPAAYQRVQAVVAELAPALQAAATVNRAITINGQSLGHTGAAASEFAERNKVQRYLLQAIGESGFSGGEIPYVRVMHRAALVPPAATLPVE